MRILEPYKDYFWEFYYALSEKTREKVDYVLQHAIVSEQISKKFFKHLEDGIYELRISSGGNIYRIFCFFEKDKLVILLHGFQKKSQKTPRKEIDQAKKIRRTYYEEELSKNNK